MGEPATFPEERVHDPLALQIGAPADSLSLKKRHPTKEETEKARNITPIYFLRTRYHVTQKIGQGSGGLVFIASLSQTNIPIIREKTLHPTEGTLMQPLSNYSKENRSNKNQGIVIIKKIKLNGKHWSSFHRNAEAKFILNVPYHPNLVQVYEMFVDAKDKVWLNISMETMGFSLLSVMTERMDKLSVQERKFQPHTAKSILAQILCGLWHIHKSGFIHCDIKPENILLSTVGSYYDGESNDSLGDNFVVKIADFGLSQDIRDGGRTKKYSSGTKGYRAPESLLGLSDVISTPSDIFSFGALAYETATLDPLFNVEVAQSSKLTDLEKNEAHLNDLIDVIGTPDDLNTFGLSYRPEFGYWRKYVDISFDLNFELAEKKHADNIRPNLQREGLDGIYEIVKGCIQWDPSYRVTMQELSDMKFFKGTCFGQDIGASDAE